MRLDRIVVDETTIALREWGPADGTPLLHLHALGPAASAALVELMAEPLVERGLRILAPDGPGFGASDPLASADEYAVEALAARVCRLCDVLELERVLLCGHSWGGAIACHAAAAAPERVRALVLLDSGHLDYRDVPGVDLSVTLEEEIERAEAVRWRLPGEGQLEAALEIDDPERRARLARLLREGLSDDGSGGLVGTAPGTVRGPVMHHLARARQSETWPAIAAAGIPTLLLLATQPDEAATLNRQAAARFTAAIPTADVMHLEGAGHGMMTDLEEALGETIATWLAGRGLV